jgi:predicted ATPase/class 3 adenylate cyclase/DNA-binding SARP family transcriptional activator
MSDGEGTITMAEPERRTEVRTFLITDVRGWTRFTLEHGDEAAARLAHRFADVVEETVTPRGGQVVELRGDEALVVFTSPREALRTAVELQHRFREERERDPSLPLQAGIGLDAGEAVQVKGGYRGSALNLAARLCSVARPGEVLASEGVVHLAGKTQGIHYLDRGPFELKGLTQPVKAIGVVDASLAMIEATPPEVGFRVHLLGDFALSHDGESVDTSRWQPRARTLFALLAASPTLRRSRDEIIDRLWPDATLEAGASNLRYTVHLLRRALGNFDPSPVLTGAGWIELNQEYRWDIDLHRFEALAENPGDRDRASLEEAAALYRGEPLLENRYEDWATPVRERAQRLWRDACRRLAELHIQEGNLGEAARWYERQLAGDPLDEETAQLLLELLVSAGRNTEALRLYAQLETRLREELGVAPAPETVALMERSRGQRAPATPVLPAFESPADTPVPVRPSYPLRAPGTLAGREAELERIARLLPGPDGAGERRLLLLSAEAGMGKTRLLAEAAEQAYLRDITVLAGGCYEEEGRLPWGPIHDALLDYVRAQPEGFLRQTFGDLLAPLCQIVPELRTRLPDVPEEGSGDVEAQRLRLFTTVTQTLERIAASNPLILLLDDLHWADDVSLQVLHFLLRQPGLDRVLLIGAFRSDEVEPGTPLESLADKSGGTAVQTISLAPLNENELRVVLDERLQGRCDERLVQSLHQRSDGNPFFTLQMAGLLQQEGRLQEQDGRWVLPSGGQVDLPPAVRDAVARRLRHVAPEVRSVLMVGAVLGREFDFAALEALAGEDEDALFDVLDSAQDAALIRESGNGYTFVHPLLWEVIYGRVPDQRRRRLHDRAGQALERIYEDDTGDRSAELAWHFVEADNRERGLRYSMAAGRHAEQAVAHAEAERHYRQAVDLARALGDQEQLSQALERLGVVLKAEAHLDAAAEVLDEAAQIQDALEDLDAEARTVSELGLTHYFRTDGRLRVEAEIRRIRDLIGRLRERDGDRPSPSLALLQATIPRLLASDPSEELEAAKEAAKLGHRVGNSSIEAAGRLRQGTALLELHRLAEARDALLEAVRLAEEANDLFNLTAACHFLSAIYTRLGQGEVAFLYAMRSFDTAERRGGLEQMAGVSVNTVSRAIWVGEWDRAREVAERHLALRRALLGGGDLTLPFGQIARINVLRGQWDEFEHADQELGAAAIGPGDWLRYTGHRLRVERALGTGDVETALLAIQAMPVFGDCSDETQRLSLLARVLSAAGRGEEALDAARVGVKLADEDGRPPVQLEAREALAEAYLAVGQAGEAEELLVKLIGEAHDHPYPYLEGCALYHLGLLQTQTGRAEEGASRLRQAILIFHRLGAQPYLERAETALAGAPVAGTSSFSPL